jgi:nitrite reductase (NADH) small subunit
MKHYICSLEDLEKVRKKAVVIGKRPVVVVRSERGSVHALKDACPHKGPCLSDGMLDKGCEGLVAGEYIYDPDTEVLRCPWHSWEFDIRTGQSLFAPEKVRVKTYAATVEEGAVFVEL